MARMILLHGAWQSAGTWDWLTPILRTRGHEVTTPALEGLGLANGAASIDASLTKHLTKSPVCFAMRHPRYSLPAIVTLAW